MIETVKVYLCNECGSDHAVMEVIYGKIKVDMCRDCVDKKEDQAEFSFDELDERSKAFAAHMKMKGGFVDFDKAWEELVKSSLTFDSEGLQIGEEKQCVVKINPKLIEFLNKKGKLENVTRYINKKFEEDRNIAQDSYHSGFLFFSFDWEETDEGAKYWAQVNNEWSEYCGKN